MGQEKRARETRFYIGAFLCALLIGGYITAIVVTRRYHAHITTVQEELLLQIQLERRVRDTAGVLAELADERVAVKNYFKNPDAVIAIIEELEGLGRVVGAPVSVLQVQVEGEDVNTREGVLAVNVLSEGSWDAVTQLLALLDALPYQASVSRVTLDTSGVDEDTPQPRWFLRATVRITLKQ